MPTQTLQAIADTTRSWTISIPPGRRDSVFRAIATVEQGTPEFNRPSTGEIVGRICADFLARREYNARLCREAADCGHAGLEWLATECDWAEIIERYGACEAVELVQAMLKARDRCEVMAALNAWEG